MTSPQSDEHRLDDGHGVPTTLLSARRLPNPWSIPTGLAVGFTVLMAVGLVVAVALDHPVIAIVPVAAGLYGVWLSLYSNKRRTNSETLRLTTRAIEHVGLTDQGFAMRRPKSWVAWSDVTGIAVVMWRGRRWLGLRTRHGARREGPSWLYREELDVDLFTALDGWEVSPGQLTAAVRSTAEAAGAEWLGDLEAIEA
jgi:hypothetical protein